ncbi:MAG: D-alanyl-D-alanine carboxypeptidase [Oscillospiraceae bacterium]|nr:D-alanyl-D-alanine carboxypeptidase [Oscillospiraceae bacterium]
MPIKIYKKLSILLAVLFVISCITQTHSSNFLASAKNNKKTDDSVNNDQEPSVSAESSILIESSTKTILFKKNENEERPVASTTKIMTALIALERAEKKDENVVITDKMLPIEGSSMNLQINDILPLSSLAKGMLTVSGNDAAHSAAIYLSGSISDFGDLMNKKAKEIGMNNTFFVTPSGLDKKNNHSTAYDMGLLGIYAMNNKSFYDIVSKSISDVPFVFPKHVRKMKNKNRLLKMYNGCVGIKTGFTTLAGRCLVSCAERNGIRLVAVTLKAHSDWNDHIKLYDYGFSRVEHENFDKIPPMSIPIVGSKTDKIIAVQQNSAHIVVEKGTSKSIKTNVIVPRFVYAPIKKGQIIGSVEYKIDDKVVSKQDLVSSDNADFLKANRNILHILFGWIFSKFN